MTTTTQEKEKTAQLLEQLNCKMDKIVSLLEIQMKIEFFCAELRGIHVSPILDKDLPEIRVAANEHLQRYLRKCVRKTRSQKK